MADLYLARTVTDTFERLVVIKKILPRYADNPRFVQLFHDEAKLALSLRHKNIVEVYDVAGVGGESFFAMEYLHGQDARSLLHRAWKREEVMPIKHGVQIVTQVASALHYAHEKRRPDGTLLDIVHRDVSPSNVLVSYDGAVKLVDFGVAKAATSSVKTRTGTLKGKIAYMSPEQAKGGSLDRRSDIFSLGIVLWELLTTQRLFRGENDLATLQLIINEAPKRPSDVNPEVPKDLERIVLRALAQDPAQRYQTALELQQELEEFVRLHQLVQSTTALGMYMSQLFAPEIASWKEAKAAGTALSEHLTHVHELPTQISESEFIEPEDEYEDEDDNNELATDEELEAMSGTLVTAEAWPRRAPTAASVLSPDTVEGPAIPLPIGRAGSQPVVRPLIPLPMKAAAPPPPQLVPIGSQAIPVMARTLTPTSVPIVSDVWRPMPAPAPTAEQLLRRRFLIAGGALLGVILVIAVAKSCGSSAPPPAAPEPVVTEPTTLPTTSEPVITPPPIDAAVVVEEPAHVPVDAAIVVDEPEPEPEIKKSPRKKRQPPKESAIAPPRRR